MELASERNGRGRKFMREPRKGEKICSNSRMGPKVGGKTGGIGRDGRDGKEQKEVAGNLQTHAAVNPQQVGQ